MKDLFGNNFPISIEVDEWWFNGRIIQKQHHHLLSKYVSFSDDDNSHFIKNHATKSEAVKYCYENPCEKPLNFPSSYIGGLECYTDTQSKNKLLKKDIDILKRLSVKYGNSENKIVEHMVLSENPLKTFLEEIQLYKPNDKFIGNVLLLVGKKLNYYLDSKK